MGLPKSVYYEGHGVVCPLTLLAQQNINQQATAARNGVSAPSPCTLGTSSGSSTRRLRGGGIDSCATHGEVRALLVPQALSSISGSSVVVQTSDMRLPGYGKNAIYDTRGAGPCGQPINQATGNPVGQPSFRRM